LFFPSFLFFIFLFQSRLLFFFFYFELGFRLEFIFLLFIKNKLLTILVQQVDPSFILIKTYKVKTISELRVNFWRGGFDLLLVNTKSFKKRLGL